MCNGALLLPRRRSFLRLRGGQQERLSDRAHRMQPRHAWIAVRYAKSRNVRPCRHAAVGWRRVHPETLMPPAQANVSCSRGLGGGGSAATISKSEHALARVMPIGLRTQDRRHPPTARLGVRGIDSSLPRRGVVRQSY